LAVLATAALAVRADAANLLGNGTFDDPGSYLTGWLNVGGNESWVADDADGAPDSGSVEITDTWDDTYSEWIYDCVPILSGATYQYGARQKTPSGQTATGEARVVLFFDSDTECLADITAVHVTSTALDAWTLLQGEGQAPPNALRGRLLLLVDKSSGGVANDLRIRFDDAFVIPEPSAGALQVAALGALAALRRRGSA